MDPKQPKVSRVFLNPFAIWLKAGQAMLETAQAATRARVVAVPPDDVPKKAQAGHAAKPAQQPVAAPPARAARAKAVRRKSKGKRRR